MTQANDRQHRSILRGIARRAMLERGLLLDFAPQALAELDGIKGPAMRTEASTRDLGPLVWCSIDNDDSRDLDQLTVAEAMPGGATKILVAIADVDGIVKKQSALDDHAQHNTTSVYTGAETFPMLPEKLSTDLTSLNYESDRLAIVVEMVITGDGTLIGVNLSYHAAKNLDLDLDLDLDVVLEMGLFHCWNTDCGLIGLQFVKAHAKQDGTRPGPRPGRSPGRGRGSNLRRRNGLT